MEQMDCWAAQFFRLQTEFIHTEAKRSKFCELKEPERQVNILTRKSAPILA
jgi:hypothetical protein